MNRTNSAAILKSIKKTYKPDTVAAEYEKLFERLMKK